VKAVYAVYVVILLCWCCSSNSAFNFTVICHMYSS